MRSLLSVVLLALTGCIANNALGTSSASQKNIYNLTQVYGGMTESEVFQIMHQPYKYESYFFGDDVYDVWFYVTRKTALGQTRLVPQNLTPLTFKNGILIAWGYDYYRHLVKEEIKCCKEREAIERAKPQPEEREDESLEKALDVNSANTSYLRWKEHQKNRFFTPELAFSSRPKKAEPAPQTTDDKPKKKYALDEEDERFQEDEAEQNFDYW